MGIPVVCFLLGACGGRTPLGSEGLAAGTTSGTTNPNWTLPTADGSCPAGTDPCGVGAAVRCYALDQDPMNCGLCDKGCTPGIACAGGACQQVACTGSLSLAPLASTTPGTPVWPRTTTADMNGDGKLDLVEWSDGGAIRVLLGNGDGSFSPAFSYPAWDAATSYVMDNFVVIGDFNEDGIPDLAVSIPGRADSVDVWLGNGDGSLQKRQPHGGQPSSNIYRGDIDRDGHLDMVISNNNNANITVLLGRGDGTFGKSGSFSTGDSAVEIVIRDWDGDGIPDLLAMSDNLHLLVGTGQGQFAKQLNCGIAVDLRESVIADFNQDGKQDVATLLYPSHSISVMLGDGRCGLSSRTDYATSGTPTTLVSGDVTGDGILDLVEVDVNDTLGHMVILVGKGDGTFVPSPETTVARDVGDILIGDVNGDGRVDVLVSSDQGVQVELNTCQ
jgi:hypothetical protein